MDGITYFTICSRNYLPVAATLHASLLRAVPHARFLVVLADEMAEHDRSGLGFKVIEACELGIPTFYDMAFRYSVLELNTAVKAAAIRYLLARPDTSAVVYFDPDCWVLSPLDHVEAALEAGAGLVLTPHITAPLDDGADPDDMRILRTGIYNLGFIACRATPETLAFLDWWAEKLTTGCLVDLARGMFVDQAYVDLAPAFVGATTILRHPGYNVAYWNLPHRPIGRDGKGAFTAAGEPIRFFHFSGLDPDDPERVSRHQTRLRLSDLGSAAQSLFAGYLEERAAMHARLGIAADAPYAYATFADGRTIPEWCRRVYARARTPIMGPREKVFAPDLSLFTAPAAEVTQDAHAPINAVMYELWQGRKYLKATFSLETKAGREAYVHWFERTGAREYGLEDYRPKTSTQGEGYALSERVRRSVGGALLAALNAMKPMLRIMPHALREFVINAYRRLMLRVYR